MENIYNVNFEIQNSLVLRNSTILYVESEKKLSSAMKPLFDQVFSFCHFSSTIKKAFDIFKNTKSKIDIILADINIQDQSSIDFVKNIREIDENIIIVVSVMAFNEGDVNEYIQRSNSFFDLIKLRINDLLQKPYQPMTTLKILSKHLVIKENERLIENQKNALFNLKYMIDHQNLLSEADLDGNIIYVNDKFCNVSGYTRDQLLGKSYKVLIHPEMDQKVYDDMWRTIRAGRIWENTVKNKKKNGGYYWVNMIVLPIIEDGKIVKYMASRQDVTEYVEQEKFMRGEIKKIKSKNYRNRELIAQKAYNEGVNKYIKEFESLKMKIHFLENQLSKEEVKNSINMVQIDQLIDSEKEAKRTKNRILKKAKSDIAYLYEKNKKLLKQKAILERKLEGTTSKYEDSQKNLENT